MTNAQHRALETVPLPRFPLEQADNPSWDEPSVCLHVDPAQSGAQHPRVSWSGLLSSPFMLSFLNRHRYRGSPREKVLQTAGGEYLAGTGWGGARTPGCPGNSKEMSNGEGPVS